MRKATESYRTYSSLVKLQPWVRVCGGRPAFGHNCSLGVRVCSERSALEQNTLMMKERSNLIGCVNPQICTIKGVIYS